GSMKPDESIDEAVVRKLRENAGITRAEIGPCVWKRQLPLFWRGVSTFLDESYVLVKVDNVDIDTNFESARPTYHQYRWWTLPELRAITDTVFPLGFADLVEPLIQGKPPRSPIRVSLFALGRDFDRPGCPDRRGRFGVGQASWHFLGALDSVMSTR